MATTDPVNILLVDDQPAKLLSYEAVLNELGENLIRAGSAREALEQLLRHDVAVILVDVCMPELDGFQLAEMIRDHPRFKKTAMVFVSAVQLGDLDRLRGYQLGAVDYVPVPVIPELLRAKIKVFAELYRKTRQLELLNRQLERSVAVRTAELEASNARMKLAIDIAHLGTWDWDLGADSFGCSSELERLLGCGPSARISSLASWLACFLPEDRSNAEAELLRTRESGAVYHQVLRAPKADGSIVWCDVRAKYEFDAANRPIRMLGVVMDITEHKRAEEHQRLMVQELHHRVKNTLAIVQSIAALSSRTAKDVKLFCHAFNHRLVALSKTHTMLLDRNWQRISIHDLVANELGSFDEVRRSRINVIGPRIELPSQPAILIGLALHELTTNAVKYGALSVPDGRLTVTFQVGNVSRTDSVFRLQWRERDGPPVDEPAHEGFGSSLLRRLFRDQSGGKCQIRFDRSGVDVDLSLCLEAGADTLRD